MNLKDNLENYAMSLTKCMPIRLILAIILAVEMAEHWEQVEPVAFGWTGYIYIFIYIYILKDVCNTEIYRNDLDCKPELFDGKKWKSLLQPTEKALLLLLWRTSTAPMVMGSWVEYETSAISALGHGGWSHRRLASQTQSRPLQGFY